MKAAVLTDWKNIEVQDIPVPELAEGECLINVKYAGVCGSDLHVYHGHHPTAIKPLVLGHEFVGTVADIKSQTATDLTIGDRVVAYPLNSCGRCEACQTGNWHVCRNLNIIGIHANGGFAEYLKASVEKVIKVSDTLSDRIAALTEPFAVGFHVNQRAGLKNGDTALIIGGGPIGIIVAMVAQISGAAQVVISEINPDRVALIEELGFTTINPTQEDALKQVKALTNEAGFDVVFEVSGSQSGLLLTTDACKIRGTIVPVGFPLGNPQFNINNLIFKELTVIGSRVYSLDDFKRTVTMLENIVTHNRFDVEKLISETRGLADLEAALHTMHAGQNLSKILITER